MAESKQHTQPAQQAAPPARVAASAEQAPQATAAEQARAAAVTKAQDELDRLYARGYLTTNDTATIKKLCGIIDGKPVEDKPAS